MTGYSVSQLAKLAKNRKIVAEQRQGRWLLEPRSLERYLESVRGRRPQLDPHNHKSSKKLSGVVDQAGYSAAWTLHQTHFGVFNLKSLLESLAIAGCSVLVGLLFQAVSDSELSAYAVYDGGRELVTELEELYQGSIAGSSAMAAVIEAYRHE